jgi:hypothetical protein
VTYGNLLEWAFSCDVILYQLNRFSLFSYCLNSIKKGTVKDGKGTCVIVIDKDHSKVNSLVLSSLQFGHGEGGGHLLPLNVFDDCQKKDK